MPEAPHPRVLFEAVSDDLYEALAPLAGTAKRIEQDDEIHPSDWDLVVSCASSGRRRDPSLHLLAFGADVGDYVKMSPLVRRHLTHARGGYVAEGLPPELSRLVLLTIVPNVPDEDKRTWELGPDPFSGEGFDSGTLGDHCIPLVHVGRERFVYAFHRPRVHRDGTTAAHSWFLPEETTGHREWLLYVLSQLREMDPERFPSGPNWREDPRWATPAVAAVMQRQGALEADHEAAERQYEEQRAALARELQSESGTAEAGMWRLLQAQGEPLVDAVADALCALGFGVRKMDDHHDQVTGAKLEDLRITDPDEPGWECLAEVKGYSKGARVSDVPQITGRPSTWYAAEKGHPPRAVWHIVNAFAGSDPSTRPRAIPADPDLKPLTDAGGALADSRDLFCAWRDVASGAADAGDVRGSMRTARTRWTYRPQV